MKKDIFQGSFVAYKVQPQGHEQLHCVFTCAVDEGQHGRGDMGAGGVARCQRTLEILFPSHGMVCSLYSTALSLTDVPSGCSKAVVILGQVSSDHRG